MPLLLLWIKKTVAHGEKITKNKNKNDQFVLFFCNVQCNTHISFNLKNNNNFRTVYVMSLSITNGGPHLKRIYSKKFRDILQLVMTKLNRKKTHEVVLFLKIKLWYHFSSLDLNLNWLWKTVQPKIKRYRI